MPERTDQEWIHQLKQNDPQARDDLWQFLFTAGIKLGKIYNMIEAGRDAPVGAYQRIMQRGLSQYRFKGSFLGYCRVILVNEFRNRQRDLLNLEKQVLDKDVDELEFSGDEDDDLLDTALRIDDTALLARLQPCLDQLDARERDLLNSRYLENQTPQAVADRLGITRNHINVIVHRACLEVRKCLQERGYLTINDIRV